MNEDDAAKWLLERANSKLGIEQSTAAVKLSKFPNLTYFDENGNLCISKVVLAKFRKISPDIVYSRSDKTWRQRASFDRKGRMQD
jgi:hypothetical protein